MFRPLVIATVLALAVPTFASGQERRDEHHPPAARPVVHPGVVPHGRPVIAPPGAVVPRPFIFHGHPIHRVRYAHPWVYPPGWAYRRWVIGAILPALFLAPAYYYTDWAAVGLSAPPPGYQWLQYGPDLLLVNVTTGQIVDVAYGVFY